MNSSLLFVAILLVGFASFAQSFQLKDKNQAQGAAYLHIPSIEKIANIITATLPGSIYMHKNVSIGVDLKGPLDFYRIQIFNLTGTSVNLTDENTILKVTDLPNGLRVGIEGFTTTIEVGYDIRFAWLLHFHDKLTVELTELDFLVDFQLVKTSQGDKFKMVLNDVDLHFDELKLKSHYWYIDYMIENVKFLIKIELRSRIKELIDSAFEKINPILANVPHLIQVFSESGVKIQSLATPVIDDDTEILSATLDLNVIDMDTKLPYRTEIPSNPPAYNEELNLTSQIQFSSTVFNGLLIALLRQPIGKYIAFNMTNKGVYEIMKIYPQIYDNFTTEGTFRAKINLDQNQALNANLTSDSEYINLTSTFDLNLYGQRPGEEEKLAVTFSFDAKITLNMTVTNYFLYLVVYECEASNIKIVKSYVGELDESKAGEAIDLAVQEGIEYINGKFLMPFDLKTLPWVGYAEKYLKKLSLRYDFLKEYFILGFNSYEF